MPLLAHDQNIINDEEFILFYDINTSSNLGFSYWQYPSFNLEDVSDAVCTASFVFFKQMYINWLKSCKLPH